MLNMFTNVLGNPVAEWKEFRSKPFKQYWIDKLEDAPPTNRHLDYTFIPLFKGNKVGDFDNLQPEDNYIGSFVPELYVLANVPNPEIVGLQCQREFKKWRDDQKLNYTTQEEKAAAVEALKENRPDLFYKLFHQDNTAKSPFELAIVQEKSQIKVCKAITREYENRRDKNLPLPAFISKFTVTPEFLQNLKAKGISVAPVGFNSKINVLNPKRALTTREIVMHYAGMWTAWLMTLATAVGAVEWTASAVGLLSPFTVAAIIASTYIAKKFANDFGLFDLAEALFRDIGWFFSKDLAWSGKLDLSKLLVTSLYLASLASLTYFSIGAVWAGAFALPLIELTALGLPAFAINAAHYALAGLISGATALMMFTGGSFPIRFFLGLHVHDNQVPAEQINADRLHVVNVEHTTEASLQRTLQKVIAKYESRGYSEEEMMPVIQAIGELKGLDAKKRSTAEEAVKTQSPANDSSQEDKKTAGLSPQ